MYNRGYFAKPRYQLIACISVCKRGRLGRNRDDSTGDETPQEILQKGTPPGNFRKAQKGEPEFSVSSLELSADFIYMCNIHFHVEKDKKLYRSYCVVLSFDGIFLPFRTCSECTWLHRASNVLVFSTGN